MTLIKRPRLDILDEYEDLYFLITLIGGVGIPLLGLLALISDSILSPVIVGALALVPLYTAYRLYLAPALTDRDYRTYKQATRITKAAKHLLKSDKAFTKDNNVQHIPKALQENTESIFQVARTLRREERSGTHSSDVIESRREGLHVTLNAMEEALDALRTLHREYHLYNETFSKHEARNDAAASTTQNLTRDLKEQTNLIRDLRGTLNE